MDNLREPCRVCGKLLVEPWGHTQSPILLFGDRPGTDEIMQGTPWIGPAGEVLHSELSRAGLDPRITRMTNVWMHEPDENCKGEHMDHLQQELVGRRAVLVMGSDPVRYFFGRYVSDITGMVMEDHNLPSHVEIAMAMVNPAIAMHSSIGEVRFAIRRFAEITREMRP